MKNAKAALVLAALVVASPVLAVPKIENVVVKPNPAQFSGDKAPEVEISISISRGRFDKDGCDARLEFGDGAGRMLDFGMASTRVVRHVYKKGGSYTVTARGAGGTPCEGSREAPLTVAQAPEPAKKTEPKKAEPEKKVDDAKKAEPVKKAAPKKAPAKKKTEPKKKPAPKKAPPKKKDEKKAEPK